MNFNNCVKKKIFKKSGIYKNKKTRNECEVLFTGINTTNAQDGQEMVCYIGNGKIFFREINEFFEKFE